MSAIGAIAGTNSQLMQEVGMKVAAKTLDVARDQGDAVQTLLDQAAEVQASAGGEGSGKGALVNVVG